MKVYLNTHFRLAWDDLTDDEVEHITTKLTFRNLARERQAGLMRGGDTEVPPTRAYLADDWHVWVPRGFKLPQSILDRATIIDERTNHPIIDFPEFVGTLRPHQHEPAAAMVDCDGDMLLQLGCGKGKAQPLDTPVLTPEGWTTMGDLRAGDFVVGSDGHPTRVLSVHPQGTLPVYRVSMEDGTSTRCCGEHLWFTQTPKERAKGSVGSVKSTSTIRATLRNKAGAQHSIPRTPAVHFHPAEPLLVPWTLGFYLGDGSSLLTGDKGRCVRFDKPRVDLLSRVTEELLSLGDAVRAVRKDPRSSNLTLSLAFTANTPSPFWDLLLDCGLVGVDSTSKFIPDAYLRGSVQERWLLLEGLLAADGSVVGPSRTLSTSSPRLCEDVVTLARSLGCRVTVEPRQTYFSYRGERKVGAPSWRMYLSHDRWGVGRYNNKQYIQSVEPEGAAECVCIRVEAPDSLYVTENYILTHNTVLALWYAYQYSRKTLIIVDRYDLADQWLDRICGTEPGVEPKHEALFPDLHRKAVGSFSGPRRRIGEHFTIATIQTIAKKQEELGEEWFDQFGLIIVDEAHIIGGDGSFGTVSCRFPGRRLALTATPERKDSLTPVLLSHFGGDRPVYRDVERDTPATWVFASLPPLLDPMTMERMYRRTRETPYQPSQLILKAPEYSTAASKVKPWNDAIVRDIERAVRAGRSPLVLGERVEQVHALAEALLDRDILAWAITGDVSRKARRDRLTGQVILATWQIAGKGLDVPQLDTLFLLNTYDDPGRLMQEKGRVDARGVEGKKHPMVVIYCHDGLKGTRWKRKMMEQYIRRGDTGATILQTKVRFDEAPF